MYRYDYFFSLFWLNYLMVSCHTEYDPLFLFSKTINKFSFIICVIFCLEMNKNLSFPFYLLLFFCLLYYYFCIQSLTISSIIVTRYNWLNSFLMPDKIFCDHLTFYQFHFKFSLFFLIPFHLTISYHTHHVKCINNETFRLLF